MGGVIHDDGKKVCSFALFNLMLSDIGHNFRAEYNRIRREVGETLLPMEYESCEDWIKVYNDMVANQDNKCNFYISKNYENKVYVVSRIDWKEYNPVSSVLFVSTSYEDAIEFSATRYNSIITTCSIHR